MTATAAQHSHRAPLRKGLYGSSKKAHEHRERPVSEQTTGHCLGPVICGRLIVEQGLGGKWALH